MLVEQNTRAALSVALRGYVLSAGHIVHEGSADQLAQSEMVQKAFLSSTYGNDSKRMTRRERRQLAAVEKVTGDA